MPSTVPAASPCPHAIPVDLVSYAVTSRAYLGRRALARWRVGLSGVVRLVLGPMSSDASLEPAVPHGDARPRSTSKMAGWEAATLSVLPLHEKRPKGSRTLHERTVVLLFLRVSKGAQTREAILERAMSLASQVGLGGVTIGRLADDLALSKSGLFAHFRSKEELQVQILERASQRFIEVVLKPALAAARGEPRVRALFESWLRWPKAVPQPGGCIFVAASAELDDQPGAARDRLVRLQRDWLDTLKGAVRIAVAEGHFHRNVDAEQFAFEMYGIMLVFHHATRLLHDRRADDRARRAFEALLGTARSARS